ncbi:hypothetical protein PIB30_012920 [Stylosanthes scabra]|uniref:Metallo-beta-lactamase domain-containing protein n=1 Tax=Stylosanthes scabra TaxID=79078 RepID=A0ABU6Y806_9FABA|nr:hypothetical protein [Stylosanthes scabra]
MQIFLSNSPVRSPQLFPFHNPNSKPLINQVPIQIRTTHATATSAMKGRGSRYLSEIGKVIDHEEHYRVARSQAERKSLEVEGYSIEGFSIGGQETCVIVPGLKCAFDIGRCPNEAIHQNFVFITNAHYDHMDGLRTYNGSRGLYNLKPATVIVPRWMKENVEKLFDIYRTMDQDDLNVDLVALDVGETFEMGNDLVVRPFKTHHVVPSQGYVVYSVRKKLKKQYYHLIDKPKQIEKLKKSGEEVCYVC